MTSLSRRPPLIPGFGFARVRDKAFATIRRLWEARQAEGWNQLDVANRLGRDPAWVSRKLSGPSNWTLRTLGELADALDGEVEISILDLHAAHSTNNYDAYSEYNDPVVEVNIEATPQRDTGEKFLKRHRSATTGTVVLIS